MSGYGLPPPDEPDIGGQPDEVDPVAQGMFSGNEPKTDAFTGQANPTTAIPRERPEPDPARAALVKQIQGEIRSARSNWQPVFDRMREDMDFAMGVQWPGQTLGKRTDRYICNVVLRHVQQLTSTLYAKNPTVSARKRKRLINTVWDGTEVSLQAAMQALAVNPLDPNALAVMMDAQNVRSTNQLLDKMGSTLEIVYNYNVEEQSPVTFKHGMKLVVRRAIITGLGYVKLGFQRVVKQDPSMMRHNADALGRLHAATRMAQDVGDKQVELDSATVEELRLTTQALAQDKEIVLREGLTFDYPDSMAIIPDINCRDLGSFMGCQRVTEQYLLTVAQVQEIYGVDVSKGFTSYQSATQGGFDARDNGMPTTLPRSAMNLDGYTSGDDTRGKGYVCVWETYDRSTGLVYETADGYPDFLTEPTPPAAQTERFWPWYAYTLNDTYHVATPYPMSDVSLMRDMQLEINRAREGLREHRHAARPKTLIAAGQLDDEDRDKLKTHPANAIIELNGLAPGQKVTDLLFPWQGPGIDMNLYETKSAMDDILRVVGVQEANLGGTSGATATESSIAESSRVTSVDASMDDMDDLLSNMARAGSQLLLLNVSTEIAQQIAGPGAVWPQASALEVAEEIYLEVQAGSSGRPNQQKEIQAMTQMAPLLLQVPGINPEWVARAMLSRVDDRARMDDALAAGLPSIQAMNSVMGNVPGGLPPGGSPTEPGQAGAAGPGDPNAQGPQGASNAPQPPGQGGPGPRAPAPRPAMGPQGGRPMVN
jgi:hypothetical protein